jgi:hypothetical protein
MTGHLGRELSVWADFNALDEHHRLRTSLRFSIERPNEGDWIWLHDGEGSVVQGLVERVDGLVLEVQAEMSTFTTQLDTIPQSTELWSSFSAGLQQPAA